MVTMIPAEPRKGANRSEQQLFTALQGITDKPDWIVLHSTVLGQNIANLTGEADFIILAPGQGILVIEAKSPKSVTYSSGEWTMEGTPNPTKNPLKQLDAARGSLRGFLQRHDLFSNAPIPRLLWLTSLGRDGLAEDRAGDMQFFEWELAWKADLAKPARIIDKVFQEFAAWHDSSELLKFDAAGFTAEDAQAIVDQLLHDFSVKESPLDRLADRRAAVRAALDQQLELLDSIDQNPHLYFDGTAGTGKSFLLQEAARKLSTRGKETLVVCWNFMMADEGKLVLQGRPRITVTDFNSLMLDLVGLSGNPADADTAWYQETLPKRALAALEANPKLGIYDAICVDEFQDVASQNLVLQLIFELAKTKKPAGTDLVIAGDRLQQIMVDGQQQVDPFQKLKFLVPDLMRITLKTNCRNAPKLARQVKDITGLDIATEKFRLAEATEGGLKVHEYTANNQAKVLAGIVKELLTEFRPEDIRILSPFGNSSLIGEMMVREARSDAERYLKGVLRYKARPGIRWRSIAKFKGLESDVVIITDLDARAKEFYESKGQRLGDALYVGATRARNWCVVLTSDGVLGSPEITTY